MTGVEIFLCAVTGANTLATFCIWKACASLAEVRDDAATNDALDNEALLCVIESNHAALHEPLMTAIARLPKTRGGKKDAPIDMLPVELESP